MSSPNKLVLKQQELQKKLQQQAEKREQLAKTLESKRSQFTELNNTTVEVNEVQQEAESKKIEPVISFESDSQIKEVINMDDTVVINEIDEGASMPSGVNKNTLTIDTDLLATKGFIATNEKRSNINEEFRSIKRKLLNNAFGALAHTIDNGNLIVVTSSRPNEGKTFTAINLALSFALEQDKTVLLVDADVLKPSVSKDLNITPDSGLIEYLTGEETDVSNIIYQTNIDKLRLVPAGKPHHLSNELLASEKMVKLVKEFATRYTDRVVIFDAPPLLGVNETTILAELAGQAVVVVESNKSKLSEVKHAVSLLPEKLAVGFVVNKSSDNSEESYGYYYGYGQE